MVAVTFLSGCGTFGKTQKVDISWNLIEKEKSVITNLAYRLSVLQAESDQLRNRLAKETQQTVYAQKQAVYAQQQADQLKLQIKPQTVVTNQVVIRVPQEVHVTNTVTKTIVVKPKKSDSNEAVTVEAKIRKVQQNIDNAKAEILRTYSRSVIRQLGESIKANEIILNELKLQLRRKIVDSKTP